MNSYIANEITVIISLWKRNNYEAQLEHLMEQTKKPYQIWIYQNESHIDVSIPEDIKKEYNISVIQSKDLNFKFYGRFAVSLLCDTEYVAIFDDDTLPGNRWLESCINTSKKHNALVGTRGAILNTDLSNQLPTNQPYVKSVGCCDGIFLDEDMKVAFLGHCWFAKTSWIQNLWRDLPYTWDNGEDIHLSAACQIYEGIDSVVPRMPANDKSLWGDCSPQLGSDEHASWKRTNHNDTRYQVMRHWYNKGWKL